MAEYYGDPTPDPQYSLARAIRLANTEIYQEAQRNPALEKMGTTVTATVILGPDLLVANVGDSRTYLLRGAGAKQLTQDHSLIAQALRDGTVTPEQVETHPYRGVITRALGSRPIVQPDFFREKLQPGDTLLLCSDGLTNEVSDELIVATISRSRNAEDATRQLVALANQNGGRDNVTAIVVSLDGAKAATAPVARSRRVPAWLFLLAAGVLAVALALAAVVVFYRPGGLARATVMAVDPTAALTEIATADSGSESAAATSVDEVAAVPQPTDTLTATATASDLVAAVDTETPISSQPTESPTPEPTVQPPTATLEPTKAPVATIAPRSTAPPATSTPNPPSYPVPGPEQPQEGAWFDGTETIELRWGWNGTLGPDEHFDVRVWREGGEHLGVAWSKEPFYFLNMFNLEERLSQPEPRGIYYWSVAIIRGQGGQVLKVLSSESVARSFEWVPPSSGGGGKKPPAEDNCGSCDCDSVCARGICRSCCADCCGGCR
jgi:protein phosphatase